MSAPRLFKSPLRYDEKEKRHYMAGDSDTEDPYDCEAWDLDVSDQLGEHDIQLPTKRNLADLTWQHFMLANHRARVWVRDFQEDHTVQAQGWTPQKFDKWTTYGSWSYEEPAVPDLYSASSSSHGQQYEDMKASVMMAHLMKWPFWISPGGGVMFPRKCKHFFQWDSVEDGARLDFQRPGADIENKDWVKRFADRLKKFGSTRLELENDKSRGNYMECAISVGFHALPTGYTLVWNRP